MQSSTLHFTESLDSLISTSQSFLECLDRHDHHCIPNSTYKGIIRICLAEILANCQSEVAMRHEDPRKYNIADLQATSRGMLQTPNGAAHPSSTDFTHLSQQLVPQHLRGQSPGQENEFLSRESVRITSTRLEGTDPPLSQYFPGTPSYIRSLSFTYHMRLDFTSELGVEPSSSQHGTCSEGQALSGTSTSFHQELREPVVQCDQEKVKCTWPGCPSVVVKNGYTRHVNETHLRKVKAVCARCEKTFPRTYMRKNHERTCRGRQGKNRSS
jgi:hypothetical protein